MKTRVISGIVLGIIMLSVLSLGFLWSVWVIKIALAFLAVLAVYELLHNALGIEDKISIFPPCVFSGLLVVCYPNYIYFILISIISFMFAVFMVLKNHKSFSLAQILALCGFPIIISFAFFSLTAIATLTKSLYYLLLLLNASSVCDMGAYFIGVNLGKHKLCPELSPKKTIEGAIGGITVSLIVSLVLALCYKTHALPLLISTIVLCIIGIAGDLFASAIKRSVGIKDYGNLIPGHGGILDRFDSILIISPIIYILKICGVI